MAALFDEFHALLVMTGKNYCNPPAVNPVPSNDSRTRPTSSTGEGLRPVLT